MTQTVMTEAGERHFRYLMPVAVIFAGALMGVLFSAYLTYLEAVVIGAWCRYCVASALVMAAIFGCAWPESRRVRGARSAAAVRG